MSDLTRNLHRARQGDPKATGELIPLVYEELRRLAAAKTAQALGVSEKTVKRR